METAHLILTALCLVAILADLYLSARHARPSRRRAEHREDARRAVLAAEQLHKGKSGDANQDRARDATQHLIELHPGIKPTRARMLVEAAVREAKS